jgi:hypothetical protein
MIPLWGTRPGYPSGGWDVENLRSTEDLAEEGAMLSVADWPLGGDMEISW